MSFMIFDIKTIPDIEGGKKLYQLHDLSDKEVANVMFYKRRQETENSEFLRLHLQRICSISVAIRNQQGFELISLGQQGSDESNLIQQLYTLIDTNRLALLSWNGSELGLPVLHYRSMLHALTAPAFWSEDEEAIGPDLQDMLAGFSDNADVPLAELSSLLGLPGEMLLTNEQVWDTYRHKGIEAISNASDAGALNTYLVYLRFQLLLGQLNQSDYLSECQLVRNSLKSSSSAHIQQFLSAWSE